LLLFVDGSSNARANTDSANTKADTNAFTRTDTGDNNIDVDNRCNNIDN
jgi:hypothetical protein